MAAFDRQLDVLRIMIKPANDDQILEAPSDVEFAIVDKSQVSRAQERTLTCTQHVGVKRLFGFLGLVPVTLRDARSRNPNLSNLAIRTPRQFLRMDDCDCLVHQYVTATNQRTAFIFTRSINRAIVLERLSLDHFHNRRVRFMTTGNDESRFRQSVTRIKSLPTEAARCEGVSKPVQRFIANRFGAIERDAPAAEIEFRALFSSDLANTEVIGEVWTTARRRLIT